jgi:hypothetical protein
MPKKRTNGNGVHVEHTTKEKKKKDSPQKIVQKKVRKRRSSGNKHLLIAKARSVSLSLLKEFTENIKCKIQQILNNRKLSGILEDLFVLYLLSMSFTVIHGLFVIWLVCDLMCSQRL